MFLGNHQLVWVAPLIPLVLILRRDIKSLLFLTIITLYSTYLLLIGGDRFEFRFMTPLLPYLYFLLQDAVHAAAQKWTGDGWRRASVATLAAVAGLLVIGTGYYSSAVSPGLHHHVARIEGMADYARRTGEVGRFLRVLVEEGYLTGNELIGTGSTGALAYYSRFPIVDTLGLNDVTVAHTQITRRSVIGHEKQPPPGYIEKRGVVMMGPLEMGGLGCPPRRHYGDRLPSHCVEAKGRYLVFRTPLDDESFRSAFARFRIIF
jgi:hypothetical protein